MILVSTPKNRLDFMKTMIIGLLAVGVTIGSCAGSKTIDSSKTVQPEGLYDVIELDHTRVTEAQPTINIDLNQNRVTGSAGCNQYGGTLVMSQNNFSVDSIMSTKMYCSDPLMAVEFKFLKLIGAPMRWLQKGDTLSLSSNESHNTIIAVKSNGQ
jgi:heat shock protein HslJ